MAHLRGRRRTPSPLGRARAAAAQKSGRFDSQIVPVHTKWKDPKTGVVSDVVISRDDGVREGVTTEALAKLPAVFKKGGSTTPGNASQVSDGAGCVVLARRSYAEAKGLPIMGRFVSFAAVGVDPKVMGIGPAVAIPEALRKAGVGVQDVDLFELNEAFASQATYCAEKLGLDSERVNVNGGAIGVGTPARRHRRQVRRDAHARDETNGEEDGRGVHVHRIGNGRRGCLRRRVNRRQTR